MHDGYSSVAFEVDDALTPCACWEAIVGISGILVIDQSPKFACQKSFVIPQVVEFLAKCPGIDVDSW